ncbi:174_t:CDS:2 [Entrophospora sp. SA101]|nr:8532_t:CDS:2 [Entrophospora sp. SA101]CAJ0638868.1 174_t:CDS:2 [Entrophospora sp. SA101]CAJ0823315.1 9597_t:CDS:2 [Entrophospora sp. SA101]CAJ0823319.1 9599_t:CDS:2 [Entrophospora sp. SA101]
MECKYAGPKLTYYIEKARNALQVAFLAIVGIGERLQIKYSLRQLESGFNYPADNGSCSTIFGLVLRGNGYNFITAMRVDLLTVESISDGKDMERFLLIHLIIQILLKQAANTELLTQTWYKLFKQFCQEADIYNKDIANENNWNWKYVDFLTDVDTNRVRRTNSDAPENITYFRTSSIKSELTSFSYKKGNNHAGGLDDKIPD